MNTACPSTVLIGNALTASKVTLLRPGLLPRQNGKLGPRVRVQFFHDATDVVLDGAFGKKQRVADLAVHHALGDELQNFFLLLAQPFSGECAPLWQRPIV